MSLYNMVMETSISANMCFALANVTPDNFPRMRDAWIADDGESLVFLARIGGGNREEYAAEIEAIKAPPGYVSDRDDSADPTYARFYFDVPEPVRPQVVELAGKLAAMGMGGKYRGPSGMLKRMQGEVPPELEYAAPLDPKNGDVEGTPEHALLQVYEQIADWCVANRQDVEYGS